MHPRRMTKEGLVSWFCFSEIFVSSAISVSQSGVLLMSQIEMYTFFPEYEKGCWAIKSNQMIKKALHAIKSSVYLLEETNLN